MSAHGNLVRWSAVWVPHDQAEARVAAALAAGGRVVYDAQAPTWWTLADTDADGNEDGSRAVAAMQRARKR